MDEGKEKETDAVFDGNIGCEESDIPNESEDEIARDNNAMRGRIVKIIIGS